jgi:hypothetical protein
MALTVVGGMQIFSHVVDQYICETRIPLIETRLLLQIYNMACAFGMTRIEHLYASEISDRFGSKNKSEVGKQSICVLLVYKKNITQYCQVLISILRCAQNSSHEDTDGAKSATYIFRHSLLEISLKYVLHIIEHCPNVIHNRNPKEQLLSIDMLSFLFQMCVNNID